MEKEHGLATSLSIVNGVRMPPSRIPLTALRLQASWQMIPKFGRWQSSRSSNESLEGPWSAKPQVEGNFLNAPTGVCAQCIHSRCEQAPGSKLAEALRGCHEQSLFDRVAAYSHISSENVEGPARFSSDLALNCLKQSVQVVSHGTGPT